MKNYLKYFSLSFSLFILATFSLSAQDDGVIISGYVKNIKSGQAVIGTNILLYKDSIDFKNYPYRGTATNSYGYYALPKIDKGNYIIIFRNILYNTLTKELNITINKGTLRYDAEMIEKDIELEEVVVEGHVEENVGISTISIPPELLTKLPSLSGEVDLMRTLLLLPGVQAASEISNGLYVRGGSPDQTLTLLDGVIVYNPSHLGNIASTFNSNALQDIRLIKGAFPAEYGGRLSSVLDLKLRAGTKERTKGTFGIGTINSHAVIEGPLNEKATFMIAGRMMYYDKIQDFALPKNSLPRYNFHDINAKLHYTLNDEDNLSVSILHGKDKLYNPSTSEDIDYTIDWQNTTVSLDWQQIHSEYFFSNTFFSYINYKFSSIFNDKSTTLSATDFYSKSNLSDFNIKRITEYFLNQNHTIKAGFDVVFHTYDLIYSDYYDENLESDQRIGTSTNSIETTLFVQDEWKMSPRLKTNLGGRLYYFKEKKYFRFEPRLSASYNIVDDVYIKGAFAVANQFLHLIVRNDITLPTDLWYPSTKKVQPSQSIQYVLGVESYLADQLYLLSIEGYYKKLDNLYEYEMAPNISLNESIEDQFIIGEGEAYGIELFLNKRFGDITGWIGYTFAYTKRKFDFLNAGKVFYPRYDRRHDVSIVLAYEFSDKLSFGLTWTYATGQGYTIPNGQYDFYKIGLTTIKSRQFNYSDRNNYRLPAYHRLDLNITYKLEWLGLAMEAYANFYNLYNRKNTFAQYISYEVVETGTVTSAPYRAPKFKQLTLFPFIPNIGINVKF